MASPSIACNDVTDARALLRSIILRFDAQRQIAPEADLAALGDVAREVLRDHDALVALDNVEPGLDIAAVVRPLRAANVTLLLTARHQLPRDAVPEKGSTSLKLLSTPEALDLFAQSYGRFAAPDLTRSELAAATRIVTTLDHHTLAVKLAGAYAKDQALDLAKLADELERDPLKPPDEETPRGVAVILGRSVTALDADGQRLFAALAAFPTNAFGRDALLALAHGIGLADPDASADVLVRRALLEATLDESMPEDSDRERRRCTRCCAPTPSRASRATPGATSSAMRHVTPWRPTTPTTPTRRTTRESSWTRVISLALYSGRTTITKALSRSDCAAACNTTGARAAVSQ